jgi:hypothetical protein
MRSSHRASGQVDIAALEQELDSIQQQLRTSQQTSQRRSNRVSGTSSLRAVPAMNADHMKTALRSHDSHDVRELLEQALHLRDTIAHLSSLVPDAPPLASVAPSAEHLKADVFARLGCQHEAALSCSEERVHHGGLTSEETAELAFLKVLTSLRNSHQASTAALGGSTPDTSAQLEGREHGRGKRIQFATLDEAQAAQVHHHEQKPARMDTKCRPSSELHDMGDTSSAEHCFLQSENSAMAGNRVDGGCTTRRQVDASAQQQAPDDHKRSLQPSSECQKCSESGHWETDAVVIVVAHALDGIQVPYEAMRDLHEGQNPRLWLRVRVPGDGAPEAKACLGSLGDQEIRRLPSGSFEVMPFQPSASVRVCFTCSLPD